MRIGSGVKASLFVNSSAQSYTGGSIKGKVTARGLKYPCTVSLHERSGRNLMQSKETDLQGNYNFENLAFGFVFFVMATDPAKKFNAVIQDNVVPK